MTAFDEVLLSHALERCARIRRAEIAFLGKDDVAERRYDLLAARVASLDELDQKKLRNFLQAERNAARVLPIPDAYFSLLNEVHALAFGGLMADGGVRQTMAVWQGQAKDFTALDEGRLRKRAEDGTPLYEPMNGRLILTQEGRQRLDRAGVTYEACLSLANVAARETSKAWGALLGLKGQLLPMEVWPYSLEEKMPRGECSVERSQDGRLFYKLSAWNSVMGDLRALVDVAMHEPQHGIQGLLRALPEAEIPEKSLPLLRSMQGLFSASNGFCPPSVFSHVQNEKRRQEIAELGVEAYAARPAELTAFYQGSMAGCALSNALGMPTEKETARWLEKNPALAQKISTALGEAFPASPCVLPKRKIGFSSKIATNALS